MASDAKERRRSRWTLGPLYLGAALVVCYLILTQMIPAIQGVTAQPGRVGPASGSTGIPFQISKWACEHRSTVATLFVAVGIAGILLPLLLRPTRYLVWLLVLTVLATDVLLAAGSYWHMLQGALKEAMKAGG